MKRGTKALMCFNPIELGQIFQAMVRYRQTMKLSDRRQFDIPFKAITRQKNLQGCRLLDFDGMEMKLISDALRNRGDFLIIQKQYLASVKFFELAQVVDEERYLFQRANGPKIKAATAGTVTAMANKAI